MSFFFDVWTYEGFVLASDVRLTLNSQQLFARKIARSAHSSRIVCAIVACGDYAQNCIDFFVEASTTKDTLREIAHCFAEKWTERYSGTEDFSAAHLVGFEKVPGSNIEVPQMWYWNNWDERVGFYKEEQLRKDLSSFSEPVPNNNHLPWKVKEIAGKFPASTLEDEFHLVMSYLRLHQPIFTWNGDAKFWRSAAGAVGSAMNLLWQEKTTWNITEVAELTRLCMEFLAKTGRLLPTSTVGLSPEGQFDLVLVTPQEIRWLMRPDLPAND